MKLIEAKCFMLYCNRHNPMADSIILSFLGEKVTLHRYIVQIPEQMHFLHIPTHFRFLQANIEWIKIVNFPYINWDAHTFSFRMDAERTFQ